MEEVEMGEYIKHQTLPQEVLLWTTDITAVVQHIPPMTPTQGVVGCLETSHNGTRKNKSRYPRTQHRWVG